MATRLQITCINKTERQNPYERIRYVGGGTIAGAWRHTVEEAIRNIEDRSIEYYVVVDRKEVDVIVATFNGRKYVKTKPDGEQPNNLLRLHECPE